MENKSITANQEFREDIQNMEKSFESSPDVKKINLDANVKHHLAHGVYCRELLIPKGCTLTGKIHRHSCLNVILKGDITVKTESGSRRFKAGDILVSPPGTKRAGYAHLDTVWLTFHHTEQLDPDLIEKEVIAESYYAFENEPDPVFPPAGLNKIEELTLSHLLAKKRKALG